jgi:hypothetical protein
VFNFPGYKRDANQNTDLILLQLQWPYSTTNAGDNAAKQEHLHCGWECKLVQPLWKAVRRFLKKLKVEMPYDPVLLDIYSKEYKSGYNTDPCKQCSAQH